MFDKLNKIDQLYAENLLTRCNGCKGIDECKQEMIGLAPIQVHDQIYNKYSLGYKKCDFARGKTNDIKIKNYNTWEADNRKQILNHINKNKSIYLWGEVGSGKTHFLYWLANQYNKLGKNIHIDFFSNIVKRINNDMNRQMEVGEVSFTEHLQNIDFLFIDDLGNEYSTEYKVSDILLPIIDYRYVNKKPTFISSNYSLGELYSLYGKVINNKELAQKKVRPLISRLKTFGEIEIKSKNWRL